MAKKFKHIFQEVFEVQDFFREPLLTLGYLPILTKGWFGEFNQTKIKNYLTYEKSDITILDLFDPRAHLKLDLNLPVPESEHEKYQTIMDYGTLEHIFDTKQSLENCFRMLKVGGLYFLHTPIRGYFRHGLHTFNPELILCALKVNDFKIEFLKYSTRAGEVISAPSGGNEAGLTIHNRGTLIWVVARKTKPLDKFAVPQQGMWSSYYDSVKGMEPK